VNKKPEIQEEKMKDFKLKKYNFFLPGEKYPITRVIGMGIVVLTCCLAVSCGPFTDPRGQGETDLIPPLFSGAHTVSANEIELSFSENTTIKEENIIIKPDITVTGINSVDNKVYIHVNGQHPGEEYHLESMIEDTHGNRSNVIIGFYGHNPDLPKLIINEFITNGSATHPDLVELKVLKSGNMAGLAFFDGVNDNWDNRLIFPSFFVQTGDFILVHCKPQGIASEVNEIQGKTGASGLDASGNAYDFWITGGTGLSGNNGVISLYSSPTGNIMDGVFYSNRTSTSDDKYLGFGSDKVKKRAIKLAQDGGWKTSGKTIAPEDGVNPEKSTSTRSVCRANAGTDTDTKNDFHIVPTKKSSFGAENSNEIYAE
jgi:hypothetical protein